MAVARKGRKRIHKGGISKLVPEGQLQWYLDSGWQLGMPAGVGSAGKVNMHNPETGKGKQVPKEEVELYQKHGWVLGLPKGKTQNAVWVKKDGVEKKVPKESLQSHLDAGWSRGRVKTTAGRVWMHRGDDYRMILPDEISRYQSLGYVVGGQPSTLNKRWLHKGDETKLVEASEVSSYLADGWHVGFGLRWVHKTDECKRVPPSEVETYIAAGWKMGLPIGYTAVTKGEEERHVPITHIHEWEARGWVRTSKCGAQAPEEGLFIVYRLVDPDGKSYIGYTKNLARRMQEHRADAEDTSTPYATPLVRGLRAHGFDTFKQEVLAEGLTFKEACRAEQDNIKKFNSADPSHGYNQALGGFGKGVRYNDVCRLNNSRAQRSRSKPQASPNHRTRKIEID